MEEVWERGAIQVARDAALEAGAGCDAIYLSVDVDVLDPGFAPGTGTPEPGGMHPADLLRAVRLIASTTNIVGIDIVEVSPPYDHSDITVNVAQRLVLEAFAGMAARKLQAGGALPAPPRSLYDTGEHT